MPYQSIGPIAALAVGTVTPLALTLYPREPEALLAGVILAGALVSMTFNPSGPPPKAYDKAVEQRAIENVVMTSDKNRVVRLGLGSVYLYAASTFAIWMTNTAGASGSKLAARLYARELGAVGELVLTWTGCLVDTYIAGIWMSSGYCGQ